MKKFAVLLTTFMLTGCGNLAYETVEAFFNHINSAENIGEDWRN